MRLTSYVILLGVVFGSGLFAGCGDAGRMQDVSETPEQSGIIDEAVLGGFLSGTDPNHLIRNEELYQQNENYRATWDYAYAHGRRTSDFPGTLEGCWIIAQDGQALGLITQNEFHRDSVTNEFGRYGSEFSSTSIFNEFGKYGGEFSLLSPFNEFSVKPPFIVTPSGGFVAYLTVNSLKTPAIDPHALIAQLRPGD